VYFLAFDIDNLRIDEMGTVRYSIAMEVTDSAGKSIVSEKPGDHDVTLPLGGSKLPAHAFVFLGPDMVKGTYNCRVTVVDRATKASKSMDRSVEVLPGAFGTVALYASSDAKGELACPLGGVAGQSLWLHFVVVNFGRDPQTKQVSVNAEIRVFDQSNKPVNEKPLVYTTTKTEKEDDRAIELNVGFPMNRAGVYTVQLKTECKLTGKSYSMSFPLVVTAGPK